MVITFEIRESRAIKIYFWIFWSLEKLLCIFLCFYLSYNIVRVDRLFFTYWRELHLIDKTFKVSGMNTAILSLRYVICYLPSSIGRCKVSCHHLHLAERRNLFILPTCILLSIVSMLHPLIIWQMSGPTTHRV